MNTSTTTDIYGRDTTLRVKPFMTRFKGMSWNDICIVIEDEEYEKNTADIRVQRRKTQADPAYELEEGEELE